MDRAHVASMAKCVFLATGLIGGAAAHGGEKPPPGWRISGMDREEWLKSERNIFRLMSHKDPNVAAETMQAVAALPNPWWVPHFCVLMELEGSRVADKVREEAKVRQLAAFLLDRYYGFPAGPYELEHVDLAKLDQRAEFWKGWFRRKIEEAFGREQVRKELGIEAAAPGLPRAGSEDGVRLPFPVLAPYPGEQARSGPAAWPILAVAFAGGLVCGAAVAWLVLRRRMH